MQPDERPDEQPVSDSNSPTPADAPGIWPPSFLRLVLAAVVVAALGFVVLKALYPIFVVPIEIAAFPEQSPDWMFERLEKAKFEVEVKNLSLAFGIIGAIFGVSCVVFAFGARSARAIAIALIGTAAMGVAGANLSNLIFQHVRVTAGETMRILSVTLDAMGQAILAYALLWGLIGLGVGIGLGSARSASKALVAGISGLCGGVLGAMLYVVLTAQFFIRTTMDRVVPYNDMGTAIWMGLFTLAIAICIALGSGERKPKRVV